MCGIGGWYCFGSHRPSADVLRGLLLVQQTRGKDAAGIAWERDGAIRIRKQKGPAKDLMEALNTEEAWEEIAASPRGILHARATTKGSEDNNDNNHPVFGFNWAVVHNGHVSNDDALFKYHAEQPRFAEVDTAAIPLVLGRGTNYLDSLRHLTILGGNITAALWNTETLERMALVRLGTNDLYLFLDQARRILYWSSAGVGAKVVPSIGLGNIRFINHSQLGAERLMILDPDWTKVQTYTINRSIYHPFVHRGTSVGSRTGARQHSTNPTTTTGNKIEAKWQRFDMGFWGVKAIPETSLLHATTWDGHRLSTAHSRFNQNPKLVQLSIGTPYGRWELFRTQDGIDRRFHPRKAIKKMFRRLFKDNSAPLLSLPIPKPGTADTDFTTEYDRLARFEHFELKETFPSGSQWVTDGYMCPWCGVVARDREWESRQHRCQFCNIQSKPGREAA